MPDSDATDAREVTDQPKARTPFRTQLDELIVGRRVRVEGTDGKRFEGRLETITLEDRHVLLRDAEELPGGTTATTVFVAEVDWIVPVDDSE